MSAQHTQGRLRIAGRETRGLPHTLVAANTLLFRVYSEAFGDVEQEGANARRLVACWNLLSPFTTEQIEAGEADVVALAAQRDELLAALRMVMACAGDISAAPDGLLEMALDDGDEETRRQANAFLVARAAIAKVKGENA